MNRVLFFISIFLSTLNLSCRAQTENRKESRKGVSDDVLNVRDFGVKGDGIADDTEALQKVLDKGTGKSIFFPRGEYIISRPLILPNSVKILGEGDVGGAGGMVIRSKIGKGLRSIFTAQKNVLEDVIIENIRTLGSKYGIYLNVSGGGAFTKVKIYNSVFQEHDVCIYVEGSLEYGMYANIIRDSYFKSSRIGIFCEGVYNINTLETTGFENMQECYLHLGKNGKAALGNSFIRNRCEGVRDSKNGLSLSLSQNTYGFEISGNYFENSFQNLIQLNGAKNVVINNNVSTSDSAGAYYLINIGNGQACITNNVGLTGIIVDTDSDGLISQIEGNSFLNYSERVSKMNVGRVNNIYNRKLDTEK